MTTPIGDDVEEMNTGEGVVKNSKNSIPTLPSKSIEAIAGLSAGFLTTLLAHPLDFLKLRLQLDTTSSSQLQSVKNVYNDVIKLSIISNNNNNNTQIISPIKFIKNIYRGISPNLIGSTSAWAFYFYFYRQYKNIILNSSISGNYYDDKSLKSYHYLLSAFAAGWTTSILTNPIWVIKTRMISTNKSSNDPNAYKSFIHGIKQIYKDEGFKGYYRGLIPSLFNVAQGAVQLTLYDIIKRYLTIPNTTKKNNEHLSTLQYFYASSVSKMISTGIFYPLQVIRSRLQIINDSNKLQSISNVVINIYKREGVRAFYKGLMTNLLRVVPATCTTFIIYEKVKQYLE
ncbi:hypothetical protein C6P42_003010 [Pichia californica]|nr:hypothetical protein C6P42_003010 [[Candida] californica]